MEEYFRSIIFPKDLPHPFHTEYLIHFNKMFSKELLINQEAIKSKKYMLNVSTILELDLYSTTLVNINY